MSNGEIGIQTADVAPARPGPRLAYAEDHELKGQTVDLEDF
jgi:hypothetical protein